MKSKRYVCFHFRHIWLPLLYTYLLATLSYADHLLGNPDFDDSVDGRRWSFYRQHRYDIKKPGPTYFLHEPDSNDINLEDIQLNSDFDSISPVYPEGVVQWLPLNENLENENADLLIGEPPNVDENVNIQVPLMGEQELELDSSEDLEKLRSILTLLEDVTGLVYQQQQKQQQLSDQENNYPRDLRFIQSKQDDQQQQAAYKDDNNNENDSIPDKAKSLSKKPQDGDESSVKGSVNQEEALSLLPLVPTKLIVPKELNLIQDRHDPMAKRFIKSSSSVLPELESPSNQQSLTVITVFICSTVFVALIAGLVLFVSKRNQNLRNKLRNLIGSIGSAEEGNEATSDYEDLCRQRMQGKNCKKSGKDEAKSILKGKTGSLAGGVIGLIGTGGGGDSKTGKTGSDSKSIDSGPEPSPPSRSSTSSWSEEPVTSSLDISTGHMILSYMEDHLKNKDRLAKEWEALCAYEVDPCSTTAAMLPQNLTKNRHSDVLPFDHSRVILNDLANKTCSDYINASTITDHDPRSPVYIVTQGPLPSTVGDFWQMVWEQGSVIVVMLTRLVENGVNLSARYWPEEGSALHTNFEIHLVSEHIWCDDYLVRSFFLKNVKTNETRTVTQFHYLTWPENGVPPNPRSLLEFRRKVNKSYRGRSCPIVVHCSDGIGRTGTYCLIDMVLNRLAKGAKEIDIAATLEHIRDQRGGSVKTKVQFEFVLEAIAEEVSAILKTLKPN